MSIRKIFALLSLPAMVLTACGEEQDARSTPIDSTTLNGTAPVTYAGEDPANEQDTTWQNSNDTGTTVSEGPPPETK